MARKDNPLEHASNGELYQGSAIRQIRQQHGLSLTELAELVGYNTASLSKVENNNAPASSKKLKEIGKVLGIGEGQLKGMPLHPRLIRQTPKEDGPSRDASTHKPLNLHTELQVLHNRLDTIEAIVSTMGTRQEEIRAELLELKQIMLEKENPRQASEFPSTIGAATLLAGLTDAEVAGLLINQAVAAKPSHQEIKNHEAVGQKISTSSNAAVVGLQEIQGVEVIRRAISLVRAAVESSDSAHREILLTYVKEQDAFQKYPALKAEWLGWLRAAVNIGIPVTHLCSLHRDGDKTLALVEDILRLIYIPDIYSPCYLTKEGFVRPAHDFLIVPGIGALEFFALEHENSVETARFYPPEDLDVLLKEFQRLKSQCLPLLKPYHPRDVSFDKAITNVMEKEGDLFLVRSSLSIETQPHHLYKERIEPALAKDDENARQLKLYLDQQKQLHEVFLKHLSKGFLFRHICSESTIRDFRNKGLYGKDDWAVDFGAQAVTSELQAGKHIQAVVDLLNDYPNYQVALLNEQDGQGIFVNWWEVKVGHAVFLQTWSLNAEGKPVEVDLEITEPTLVEGFKKYFDSIWNNLPNSSKNNVTESLQTIAQIRRDEI